jgi:hypothetical protein
MTNLRNVAVALTLALAVVGAATPVLAAQRTTHPGHAARAQAVPGDVGGDGMSAQRAAAIRDCMNTSGKFAQSTWGNRQFYEYRTCMAEHGEME